MTQTQGTVITTDIAIIGSGMGGGTLAYALRNHGAKVLIIERGGYLPREPENWSPTSVFVDHRYRGAERFLDEHGKPFRAAIFYGVGGNTKVYGAALPRFRREDFGVLETEDGVSPAWPITYDELEPYYAEAERLFRVHGTAGADPIEPPRSTPYPFPAVPHEPVIADLAGSFEQQGLKPYPLQLGIDLREGGACIRCKTCDGFPCQVLAKSDAETCVTTPALESDNVDILLHARAVRLDTDPTGRRISGIEIDHDGSRKTVIAKHYVLATSAINSAAMLLRSANDKHPNGLANSSGLVGRGFMMHVNSALMGIRPTTHDTVFQKTLAVNDWYFGDSKSRLPAGNAQLLGKLQGSMIGAKVPFVPGRALTEVANRSVDWYLMTEDLPDPDNRVSLDASGRIVVRYRPNNERAHKRLARAMGAAMRRAGYPMIVVQRFGIDAVAHQCGTVRFGDDPATSVLDPLCRAHDVDNLLVMDAGFLPSSGAQNPALTIAAQALRVAEKVDFN
ncbi:MAG: GMC family oxidoreductase [Chloroflexota bacterium]